MDFVDGKSAKQRLEDEGAFPAREAASICADIASALEFVHRAGVLHRDVKPHNVLRDRGGKALLSDFGLAKELGGAGGMTVSGAALGTPAYMPPEIAARGAKTASPASDVYSLGATLYEMMTGRAPFEGANGIEFVRMIVETDPAPPRSHNPSLHPDLEVVCMKAMHKEPARRYESAAAFEADLRRFLNGEPIVARPVGRVERLVMKAKRHSGPVSAACIALALLLGTGGWWLARRISADRSARLAREEKEAKAREAAPLLEEGRSLLERAEAAQKGGDAPLAAERVFSAERLLARAAALVPDDPEARLDHARALRMSGRWREALMELDKAVELSPRHAIAWFERASIALDRLWLSRSRAKGLLVVTTTNDLGYRSVSSAGMTKVVRGASEKADSSWNAVARHDFGKVMECGAAPERAAYGRAVLAFLSGDHAQAETELAQAMSADPYFVPAITLQAEIAETSKERRLEQLAARKRIHELEPFNSSAALDYAMLLVLENRQPEAMALVASALRTGENPDDLLVASSIEIACGQAEAAEAHARRALALQKDPVDIRATVSLLGDILSMQKRVDAALAMIGEHEESMEKDIADTYRLEWLNNAARFMEATRLLRKYKLSHRIYGWAGHQAAHAEWNCGNLDRAGAITQILPGKLESTSGVVALDRGDAETALRSFQEHLRVHGHSPEVHSNLAAAHFLLKDYGESIRDLERGIVNSPIPERVKESVKPLFMNLLKRAEASNSPAEAGKVVESLAGLIQLAAGQSGADNATQAAASEAQRGLMFALQEFYYRNGMYEQSLGAGRRYMKFAVSGNVLYKQARSLAASGKRAGALAALAEAMEKGFDDGSRLDADEGFEALRKDAEFESMRKACR
jgi:tetratricopeptide (TPR) repeat protein